MNVHEKHLLRHGIRWQADDSAPKEVRSYIFSWFIKSSKKQEKGCSGKQQQKLAEVSGRAKHESNKVHFDEQLIITREYEKTCNYKSCHQRWKVKVPPVGSCWLDSGPVTAKARANKTKEFLGQFPCLMFPHHCSYSEGQAWATRDINFSSRIVLPWHGDRKRYRTLLLPRLWVSRPDMPTCPWIKTRWSGQSLTISFKILLLWIFYSHIIVIMWSVFYLVYIVTITFT